MYSCRNITTGSHVKSEKISELKDLISQKIDRLEKQRKMLRQKRRKILTKELIRAGEIISKAEMEHIEPEALLGALLEIKEKAQDQSIVNAWFEKGKAMLTDESTNKAQPLIISFNSELPAVTKAELKKLKFKWNAFRKEWYGYGMKKEIETIFKQYGVKIDTAGS